MKELARIGSKSGYIMRKLIEEKSLKNKMSFDWDDHEHFFFQRKNGIDIENAHNSGYYTVGV